MRKRKLYTFFELLITLATLALFLFSLPGLILAGAESDKKIECKNNLKKMYESILTYTEEFNAFLPVRLNSAGKNSPWFYILAETYPQKFNVPLWSYPNGRKFWHCPSCQLNNWEDSCSAGASDYGLNILAYTTPQKIPTAKFKESAPVPFQKFLLADIPLNHHRPYISPTIYLSISNRHDFRGNYIFFDGHLDEFTKKQVYRWKENDWSSFSNASDQTPWNCNLSK